MASSSASSSAADDDIEITVLQIKQCFVNKVPPLATADGHRAENWDRTAIWDGRLRIVVKGKQTVVLLEHVKGPEAGTLFAACPVHNDPKRPPSVDTGACVMCVCVLSQVSPDYVLFLLIHCSIWYLICCWLCFVVLYSTV